MSPLYLRPGFAFGSPCLPMDVRALCAMARRARLDVPLLSNVFSSNARHLRRAVGLVFATAKCRVAVLGLVLTSDADNLREGTACAMVKSVRRAGKQVAAYDSRVRREHLIGAKRDLVE
jgi:GDP-mannose 6-dehydrogenase